MIEPRLPAPALLHAKLMLPRLHSALIPRPALVRRLDAALEKKLTLVVAPTGFGKTALVSQWQNERGLPSAWVTLDEHDNDPVRYWTYVIAALRTFDGAIGKTALAALTTSQPPSFQTILVPLINDLAQISRPSVLVLEDYDTINSPEIHAALAYLLSHMPASLHLVLVTRTEPHLPLGILRARDEMLEIDAASLRFSRDETAAFLREELQVELALPVLIRLHERIEGWAAGLRLTALALQSQDNAHDAEKVIESFSGSHRYVTDYLMHEVFEHQPSVTQAFLLNSCFLTRLTGSLCDALTGGGGGEAVLEQLERANLFVVRLEHAGGWAWYRYNGLFAESIQALARHRLGEAGVQSIFEKASAWYESQNLYADAIEAALAAKLSERALALIEMFIDIHSLSELRTLGRWLASISAESIFRHPEACLAYAQVILYTSDRYAPATARSIEPFLVAAQKAWESAGNTARLGAVSALRGMILLWQGDFEKAFDQVHRSLEQLPEHDVFWRGISLLNAGWEALLAGQMLLAQDILLEARALMGASQNLHGVLAAMQFLSEVFFWQGDLEPCVQLSREIMDQAFGGDEMLDDQGTARINLAHVAYERNDLDAAGQYAAQALEMGRLHANESLQTQAVIRLAQVDMAQGDFVRAQERLKAFVAELKDGATLREIQWAQALAALRAGDAASLAGWQPIVTAEKQDVLLLQKEREISTLARLRIAQGCPGKARALLEPWQAEAAAQGRVRSQAEAWCLEALSYQAAGDSAQARQALSQALSVGHQKGFCRLFLDEGAPMAALLHAVMPALSNRGQVRYATTLLHSFPPAVTASAEAEAGVLVEPLSQQEVRVLRLLVAGMSNSDIARELVVSRNTVKTHVKSV